MGIMSALSVAVATYSAGASFITAAGVFFGQLGFFGRLVLGIAGSAILRALAPKPSAPRVTGYTLTATGAALNHQVVYGKIRVAGAEVFKATTGSDNKFLHLVLAFTGHEIEAFDEIWINDQKATLDGNGNVTTVTDEEGNTSSVYDGKLTIIKRLGGSDNDTPPEFDSAPNRPSDAGWTSEHKLTGISYLYCRLKFDRDAFPNGVPEIQATIKGKKVYNPITAVTEWSDNPALCLRDYLTNSTYGLGEDADNIDDDLIETAYNACNEAGVVTETKTIWSQEYTIGSKKFTCNGAFTTDSKPVDILEDMLTSMGGAMWYAQGKWRIRASKYTAPTITFDEDDLRSGVSVSTRHSTRDNFNIVKGIFRGIESNYIDTDYPEVRNVTEADSLVVGERYTITKLGDTNWNTVAGTSGQTYNVGDLITVAAVGSGTGTADFNVGTDNGIRSPIDMALPFTSDSVTARRIARIALERHRQQLSVSATFGMRAFNVQVGDTVSITNNRFGWSAKEFEVLSWILVVGEDLSVNVQMDLRETAASVFDEVDDAVVYERDNSTLFSPFEVPTVTVNAPTIGTSVNKDGSVITHADFTWSSSDDSRISYYLFEYSFDGSNYNNVRLDGTRYRLTPLVSGQTYYYRVTPYNYLGVQGTPVDGATGLLPTDDDTTPNAPTGVSVVAEYRTATVSWTEPTTNTDGSDFTDLKHYEVYRGTSTNPTTLVARVAASKFTDGGLADNTTYYYRVKAVDRSNNPSSFSVNGSDTTNPELTDGVDGADGADGANGADGVDGDTGDTVVTGKVYYTTLQSSAPSTPSATSFNTGTGLFTGLTLGWSRTQPSIEITDTAVFEWSSDFVVTISGVDSSQTITFASPSSAIQVTTDLESDNYSAGVSGWHLERDTGFAEFGSAAIRDTLSVGQIPDLTSSKVTDLGSLATQNTVDYNTEVTNTPDLSAYATTSQLNAKSTVIYSSSTPTSTSTNDLWYHTTQDRYYRYNGSSWVPVAITADSIVSSYVYAGNINASQITASTITSDFFIGAGITRLATDRTSSQQTNSLGSWQGYYTGLSGNTSTTGVLSCSLSNVRSGSIVYAIFTGETLKSGSQVVSAIVELNMTGATSIESFGRNTESSLTSNALSKHSMVLVDTSASAGTVTASIDMRASGSGGSHLIRGVLMLFEGLT